MVLIQRSFLFCGLVFFLGGFLGFLGGGFLGGGDGASILWVV